MAADQHKHNPNNRRTTTTTTLPRATQQSDILIKLFQLIPCRFLLLLVGVLILSILLAPIIAQLAAVQAFFTGFVVVASIIAGRLLFSP